MAKLLQFSIVEERCLSIPRFPPSEEASGDSCLLISQGIYYWQDSFARLFMSGQVLPQLTLVAPQVSVTAKLSCIKLGVHLHHYTKN